MHIGAIDRDLASLRIFGVYPTHTRPDQFTDHEPTAPADAYEDVPPSDIISILPSFRLLGVVPIFLRFWI